MIILVQIGRQVSFTGCLLVVSSYCSLLVFSSFSAGLLFFNILLITTHYITYIDGIYGNATCTVTSTYHYNAHLSQLYLQITHSLLTFTCGINITFLMLKNLRSTSYTQYIVLVFFLNVSNALFFVGI